MDKTEWPLITFYCYWHNNYIVYTTGQQLKLVYIDVVFDTKFYLLSRKFSKYNIYRNGSWKTDSLTMKGK